MDVQVWTYILVGITFAIYIGIAIWSKAGSTSEFYVAEGAVKPLTNGMATAPTGCQRLLFFPWPDLSHLWATTARFT